MITAFDGCHKLTAMIKVPEIDDFDPSVEFDDDETGVLGIPNSDPRKFDLADLVFWIVLTLFGCAICFCCGRTVRRASQFWQARGGTIAIEDEPSRVSRNDEHVSRGRPEPAEDSAADVNDCVVVFVNACHIGGENRNDDSSLTDESVFEMSV